MAFFLWNNPSFSDLTIRFDDGDVPGHKAVFAQKSVVFKDYFEESGSSVLDMRGHHRFFVRVIIYECCFDGDGNRLHWFDYDKSDDIIFDENCELGHIVDKGKLTPEEVTDAIVLADKYDCKNTKKKLRVALDFLSNESRCTTILIWPLWSDDIVKTYRVHLKGFVLNYIGHIGTFPYWDPDLPKMSILDDTVPEAIDFLFTHEIEPFFAFNYLKEIWKQGKKERAFELCEKFNLTKDNIGRIKWNWFNEVEYWDEEDDLHTFREILERKVIIVLKEKVEKEIQEEMETKEEHQTRNSKIWELSAISFLCKDHLNKKRKRKGDEE